MRPVPGRGGVPVETGGFKTPFRRRGKLRYIRDALRGRASLIPLRCPSSSPPQPLRWVAAGCPYWLRRKENAPFDGVREKALAAQPALRASWRKCGGLPNRCRRNLRVFCRVRSTLAVDDTAPPQLAGPWRSSWGGRSQGLSFYSRAFRFAMRCPGSRESRGRKVPSYPQQPRCGSEKRTAEHP